MKRIAMFFCATAIASPAHAFWGIGDVTFDPTSYGAIIQNYNEMVKMYETTTKSLDKLSAIETSLKKAESAAQSLGSGNISNAFSGMGKGLGNAKTAAQLRAELADMESKGGQSASYLKYQLSLIDQLDKIELLDKATADNAKHASGQQDATTSAAITAQSTSALANLAALEQARRTQEDMDRANAAQAERDSIKNSSSLYKAIGDVSSGKSGSNVR